MAERGNDATPPPWGLMRGIVACVLAGCVAACATTSAPFADDAVLRLSPAAPSGIAQPGDQVAASVFLTIHGGSKPDRLLAITTWAADRVELHLTRMEDAIMRMEPVDSIDVPASGEVRLAPGGYHAMLFGLRSPGVSPGDVVTLTLLLESGEISVAADVIGP